MNAARLDAVREQVAAAGLAGALATDPAHVWWLTGDHADPGSGLLVAPAGSRAVTEASLGDALLDLGLLDGRPRAIGVDGGPGLGSTEPVRCVDATAAFAHARRAKDAGELVEIEHAARVVDDALAAARDAAVAGARDHDVFAAAAQVLAREAGPEARLEGNLGAGAAGADPDAVPTGATLRDGEWLFVDLYPRVGRYYGDATRVFAVGVPSERAERLHRMLWEALDEAAQILRPGVAAAEVDARCREVLAAADLDRYFPHHTGHGLGLFQQELPMLMPGSADVLRVGDVVTLEPGAYLPGVGGMRVEDVFVIEPDGARRITGAPRALAQEVGHG